MTRLGAEGERLFQAAEASGDFDPRFLRALREELEARIGAGEQRFGELPSDPAFQTGPRLAKAHEAVRYRESDFSPEDVAEPMDPSDPPERCGTCRFYRGGSCQLVEGSIDARTACAICGLPAFGSSEERREATWVTETE